MSKQKKRNIIIGSLCAVVLLMAVGYAAFQTVLNINGTSNITSSWNIKITSVTSKNIKGAASNNGKPTWENLSAIFKTNLQSPGDSIEYEITVTNSGNINAKLDKYTLTDTNNEAIKFTQTGLTNGEVLTSGSTKTFAVKVEYLNSVTDQPSKVTSSLTITLDYSQAENGYTPSDQTASEQLTSNIVTSGDGLYEDAYETGRYVYKGANPNNYIKFNNEEWRILAVENDGTLKIRRNASIGDKIFDSQGYRDKTSNGAGGTYCAQGSYGCNAWAVNDNFTSGSLSGTVLKDATLNTYLNNDYYNTLSSDARNQIQSHNYGIGPASDSNTDLVEQIISENSTTWNGNIGLMSASDYLMANTNIEQCGNNSLNNINYSTCKATNYLVPVSGYLWTISPVALRPHRVFIVGSSSWLGTDDAFYGFAVWPVLYLKSDITLSGDGTKTNPYTIN